MINVVTDFGAQNNGIGSNYTSLFNALTQAKNNGGDEVYFPPGIYKIKGNAGTPITPISLTGFNKVRLYGKGAVIICDTDAGILNVIGDGGGFAFDGNDIIVEDLEIVGMQVPIGNTSYGYGRLLQLNGDNNTVRNCHFKYGNGGALNLYGSYVTISGNRFDQCNNYAIASADYGAIQITGGSSNFNISGNFITDQFYSGICCYGNLENTDIVNNYIRSYSASGNPDHSMGIFFLGGSYTRVKITGNTIERIDAEGIMIAMDGNNVSSHCIIANNIIRDCAYRGISLDVSDNAEFRSYTVADNVIENTAAVPVFAHQIGVAKLSDSHIAGNRLIGYNAGTGSYAGTGIYIFDYSPRNQIVGNNVSNFNTGITFFSPDGMLSDNIVTNCSLGIDINFCRGSNVHGNLVKFCATGVNTGGDPAPQIYGNSVTDCTIRFSGSPAIQPEFLTHTGTAAAGNYSALMVTGALTLGAGTITFYNIFANDRFLVLPLNQSSDVQGALYVSAVNTGTQTITVRSTLSSDNRSFIVIKLLAGG